MNKFNSLIDHLESEFGIINKGWSIDNGIKLKFQIVEFHRSIYEDIVTFSTLGFSKYALSINGLEKIIKQELFILIPVNTSFNNTPAVLYDIGNWALEKGSPYLRGQVIDMYEGYIFLDKKFTCFYVAPSVYFSEEFAVYKDIDGEIFLCWLIPIYESEKLYIQLNGWESFENLIEAFDPNFFDFDRDCIVPVT